MSGDPLVVDYATFERDGPSPSVERSAAQLRMLRGLTDNEHLPPPGWMKRWTERFIKDWVSNLMSLSRASALTM